MAGPYLYIGCSNTSKVVVWDTSVDAVHSVLTGVRGPARAGMCVSQDLSRVYTRGYDNVSVSGVGLITTSTLVYATVGGSPLTNYAAMNAVASSLDGAFIYLSAASDHMVKKVDPATGNILASSTVVLSAGNGIGNGGLVMSPDGATLFGGNPVRAWNVSDLSLKYTTSLMPGGGWNFGFSPDGTTVYYGNYSSGVFGAFFASTGASLSPAGVSISPRPVEFVISLDGTRAYVAAEDTSTVTLVNLSPAPTLGGTVSVPGLGSPAGAAMTPDGAKVYFADKSGSNLCLINTATLTTSSFSLTAYGKPDSLVCAPVNRVISGGGGPSITLALSASVVCDARTVSMSWTEINGTDTTYSVYRNGELIAVVSGLSYVDVGPLALPGTFAYQVIGNTGLASNVVSVSTFACAPTGCNWTASSCPGTTWAQASSCPGTTWTAANPVPASVWTKG